MTRSLLLLVALLVAKPSLGEYPEPQTIPLWPGGAPGFEGRKDEPPLVDGFLVKNVHNPSITAFLPDPAKATGAAVLVCPGGAHRELWFGPEGLEPSKYLRELGIAAFALKYRLGRAEGSPYKPEVHAREDAQRALRLIRSRADSWGIDPKRLGMLGFSAGGEVVTLASLSPDSAGTEPADPIDRLNGRPDFSMYVYPGPLGIPESIPQEAPPGFVVVAADDVRSIAPVIKLISVYQQSGASFEAHVFARGNHGFHMGARSNLQSIQSWPQRMTDWLTDSGYLGQTATQSANP